MFRQALQISLASALRPEVAGKPLLALSLRVRYIVMAEMEAAAMNLQIRDPQARELARRLAEKRNVSMTEAVIEALESELERHSKQTPLAVRLAAVSGDLKSKAGSGGRTLSKDEVDEMWGHS